MKRLLYTGHDNSYAKLAAITVPRMRRLAIEWGWHFTCAKSTMLDVPNAIYWTGVMGALIAFEAGYDEVMYLDVDQLITNFDDESPRMLAPSCQISIGKDWGEDATDPWSLSACGFVANRASERFFKAVLKAEPEWRDKPFPEQGPLVAILKEWTAQGTISPWLRPRRTFGSVPDEVCPGKVPEPWQPGDFAAHLTMIPIDQRVALAEKLIA